MNATQYLNCTSRLPLRVYLLMHPTRTCSGSRPKPPIWYKLVLSPAGYEPSILESELSQFFSSQSTSDLIFRWLVYNLSPSFNWAAHGFSGVFSPESSKGNISLFYPDVNRNGPEELCLGPGERRVGYQRRTFFRHIDFFLGCQLDLSSNSFRWRVCTLMRS